MKNSMSDSQYLDEPTTPPADDRSHNEPFPIQDNIGIEPKRRKLDPVETIQTNLNGDNEDGKPIHYETVLLQPRKRKDPLASDKHATRYRTIATGRTQQRQIEPGLKYTYVWQHLEKLYEKLNEEEIAEFNVQFINQVFEKTKQTKANEK